MDKVMRQPVQARALKTRAALLLAAQREFSSAGYASTTARSIAARAGTATGSFYQYFADKDAALRELARERSAALAEQLLSSIAPFAANGRDDRDARFSMARVVSDVVAYHREDTGLHAVLTERRHADPQLDAITSEAESRLIGDIDKNLRTHGFAGDRRATAFVIFSMIEGAIHAHVLSETPDQTSDQTSGRRPRPISDKRLVRTLSDAVVTLVSAGIPAVNGES
jgi:AcrR family transcriptional regulator